MKNYKIICYSLLAMAFCLFGVGSIGDELSNHQFTFELRDAQTNTLIQTKTSNEEVVVFDPIAVEGTAKIYKIIEKNLGEENMVYDDQVAYIGFRSDGHVSYQKDNTYKYLSKDGEPHPYHATEQELQGEAYIEIDTRTGVETFFRDTPGKYVCAEYDVCPFIDGKFYVSGVESGSFRFPNGNTNMRSNAGDAFRLNGLIKEVVVKDAIRPVGSMNSWFYHYDNLEKADIKKLDTSKATSLQAFFAYDRKLSDVDITGLDFSSLRGAGSLRGFFSYADKIQEFDSRHYDFSSTADLYVTGEFFAGDYYPPGPGDLRYINLERMVSKGSSAEFSNQRCVEKLVLGESHSLYNGATNFGDGSPWLNVETGELVPPGQYGGAPSRFQEYLPELMKSAAGTYVNPTCNVEPALFENTYKKPEEPKPVETTETIKNPTTASTTPALFFMLFGSLSAGVALIIKKH